MLLNITVNCRSGIVGCKATEIEMSIDALSGHRYITLHVLILPQKMPFHDATQIQSVDHPLMPYLLPLFLHT